MPGSGRYPTQDEIEVITARARRMRSLYVGALIRTALLRLQRAYPDATVPRSGATRRFYADVG
jgi:hypothetical protein